MAISSNTLFHFTKEYEYLKQSIEEGLWPRYCIEKKWHGKDFVIPMLCFCDIPLSQVKDHIGRYGCYGIGVTKNFARKNKITPVTYIHQGSLMYNKIDYYISRFSNSSMNRKRMDLKELMLYYIKKVSGYNDYSEKKCKFYNEREWRYVPSITPDIHLEIIVRDYDENLIKNELSKRTESCKLKLTPDDIAYIIVNEQSEIRAIMDVLKKTYSDYKYLEQLYAKIITVKQIKEDF